MLKENNPANKAFVLEGVSFSYRDTDSLVLDNITLDCKSGEWLVIIGRNGSGKSTLLKLLNALLKPKRGVCHVFGLDVSIPENVANVRVQAAMVFQNPESQIVGVTVEDDAAFALENQCLSPDEIERRIANSLSKTGLLKKRKSSVHSLSGGEKQKLTLAGAIAQGAGMFLLDEATSMLDSNGREDVLSLFMELHSEGHTIIQVTHNIEEVRFADRIAIIDSGRIFWTGGRRDFFNNAESLGFSLPTFAKFAKTIGALDIANYEETKKKALSLSSNDANIIQLKGLFDACGLSIDDPLLPKTALIDVPSGMMSNRTVGVGVPDDPIPPKTAVIEPPSDMMSKRTVGVGVPDDPLLPKTALIDVPSDTMTNRTVGVGVPDDPLPYNQIDVLNLSHVYSDGVTDKLALDNISFSVKRGELISITGQTGSGKSTLVQYLDALFTVKNVENGKILFDGQNINISPREIRRRIGMVFQFPEHQLFAQTVREELSFALNNWGIPRDEHETHINEALEQVGISKSMLDRSPLLLSGGEMRAVCIASALVTKPFWLIMDEPIAGLDAKFKRELLSLLNSLKSSGVGILIVTHDLEFALLNSDRALVLQEGKLVCDAVPKVTAQFLYESRALKLPDIVNLWIEINTNNN